jgi:CHAT domain-containing protein
MGLTRAWIGAGADAVLATLWPTEDDDGHFFQPFYESLRQAGTTPAVALQRAQIAMLHSGTFRANPDYWSTYFVVENDR